MLYAIIFLKLNFMERMVRKVGLAVLIVALLIIIIFLAMFAVLQLKMAGIEVNDFVSFIKANDTLNKLYAFSHKYQKLTPQQQILFLKETERVLDAFDKVPDALWEEDYDKYMDVLNKYKDIRMERWEEASEIENGDSKVVKRVIHVYKDDSEED